MAAIVENYNSTLLRLRWIDSPTFKVSKLTPHLSLLLTDMYQLRYFILFFIIILVFGGYIGRNLGVYALHKYANIGALFHGRFKIFELMTVD